MLSRVFRGKYIAALRDAYAQGTLDLAGTTATLRDPAPWHAFVNALFDTDWVVYAKPAFEGERVTFQWKDYAHGNQSRTMTLPVTEFLRRFVQHVLPRGFVRIRHFGYLATACRTARLARARALLAQPAPPPPTER